MENKIKEIDFFSDKAIFEPITDSNSGAILRKVIDGNHEYFLKIVSKNSVDIEKLKKIINIYEKGNVDTIQLLKYGWIDDKIYLIYNFIEGAALNTIYDKHTSDDFYNMGFTIGCQYRKINYICEFDDTFNRNYNIDELLENLISQFLELYEKKLSYLQDIISKEEINEIIYRARKLLPLFQNETKVYIHSDIHPKNIMLSHDKLYIIDIEAFAIDYFIMNIRWSVASAFKNKKNNQFFIGFIDGFYDKKVSKELNQQLIFILIFNFIEHIIEFSDTKNEEFIQNYTKQIKFIFEHIDLDSDDNILKYNSMILKE